MLRLPVRGGGGGFEGSEAVESHIISKLQETLSFCYRSSVRPSIYPSS
jgi:hypothetical protein